MPHLVHDGDGDLVRELGAGLVDWVGIDVKATPDNYEAVAGRSGAGERAWESLDVVLARPEVDHEVRLTVYPDGPGDGFEVAARAREMGVRSFALQQARDMGTPDGFSATRPGPGRMGARPFVKRP